MERTRGFDPSCLGASQALQVEVSLFLSSPLSQMCPPLQHRQGREGQENAYFLSGLPVGEKK